MREKLGGKVGASGDDWGEKGTNARFVPTYTKQDDSTSSQLFLIT